MIEMGMGEDHRIDVPGRPWERLPVAVPQLARTLEQAAVQQDPRLAGLDQELAAGYRARAAQEGQRRARILTRHSGTNGVHARSL